MRVLTFGELLIRLSSPGYEKLFQSDCVKVTFCGGEANVAVSLSNFGISSRFVTKLPDSDIGIAAKRTLDYFGVDTSCLMFGDGRMGLYYVEKGASQRPSKVIYDRKLSSFALANQSEFDWDKLFKDVDWFHWTGITPALSGNVHQALLSACKKAKERGLIVSCDLNYRRKLWSPEEAQKSMKELMPYVDVCIGNEEDAQLSLGINANDKNIYFDNSKGKYKKIASVITEQFGCKYVAFSLRNSYSATRNGWSGVLCCNGKSYHSKEYDIEIVDRIGGGDSFAAALIFGLLNNYEEQKAIEFAVAASCLKQTIEGDFNRVSVDDVCFLMNGSGNGRIQR